jgi:hypothetical protein
VPDPPRTGAGAFSRVAGGCGESSRNFSEAA